jgi:transposase
LGTIEPLPGRYGRPWKLCDDDLRRLRELVEAHPDATLRELRDKLQVDAALSTLCDALQRMKLSFKKKSCTRPSKTGRTSKRCDESGIDSSKG